MTPENKEIIKDITSNPSRLSESYIRNNYNGFYEEVLEYNTENNLPLNISFKEKLWYYIHNIRERVTCKICGNNVNFNRNFKDGYKQYCSAKCTQQNPDTKKKRMNTTIKKYGVDNIAKLNETKEKMANTNIERYGFTSSFQSEEVKSKWRENIKEKYNVNHVFQLESVKEKIKETNNDRYGVDYFVQSDEYKCVLIEMNHSGNMKLIYNNKTINTNMDRYGVQHYTQSDEYKKFMNTDNMKKYLNDKLFENRSRSFEENFPEYELISTIPRYITLRSKECGHTFEIFSETFYMRYYNGHNCCLTCLPLNSISQSSLEIQMREFLDSINIEYIPNHIFNGIELDIFIPIYNIAIEMNGLYWHSEIKKHRFFHKTKTEICEKGKIQLIHVWEDDWIYKKDIIKSILINRLKLIENKIYARKCNIKEVSAIDSRMFLDGNHIQGSLNSKIKLGLYYKGELVSLMTFGNRYINGKKVTELTRFCNMLNTNVIGGASKLFKYYVNNYEFDTIKSYADISTFSGDLYKQLGFDYIHRSSPNYFWVVGGIRKHRFNYNKKKLIEEGFDPNMTEKEIMYSRGYIKIWGCGLDLYTYKK